MKALGLTDRDSLVGIGDMFRLCESADIKPIIGVDLGVEPIVLPAERTVTLLLLCEQDAGYRSLCRLLSLRRVRKDAFSELSTGLVAILGTEGSELFYAVSGGNSKLIESYLNEILSIFGRDNVYIALVPPRDKEHERINRRLVKLAQYLKLPMVATNNVHYLYPDEDICYRFLKREHVDFTQTKESYKARCYMSKTLHFLSVEEMNHFFQEVPSALENTCILAERCTLNIEEISRNPRLYSYERGRDPESYLWDLISERSKACYGPLKSELKEQLNQEFNYIIEEGMSEFIIFLYNLKKWTKENNCFFRIGKGAILSSVIAYVLDITDIDPLKFNFRFSGLKQRSDEFTGITLETSRNDFPFILHYLRDTYGEAQIAATSKTIKWHKGALLLELCKWSGMSSTHLIRGLSDGEITLKSRRRLSPFVNDEESMGVKISDISFLGAMVQTLGNRPRGIEPVQGGIVIAAQRIDTVVPVTQNSSSELPLAVMPRRWLDRMRLIRTHFSHTIEMDIIQDTIRVLAEEENIVRIPENCQSDEIVYRFFAAGNTTGIPGFEGVTAQSLLRRQQPHDIFQLVRLKSTIEAQLRNLKTKKKTDPDAIDDYTIYTIVADCLLACMCAYFMTRFPDQYSWSVIKNYSRRRDKLIPFIRRLRYDGKIILPPDINLSEYDFTREEKGYRAGLRIVKGIGRKVYDEIDRVRRGGAFNDVVDLCRRTDSHLVNHRIVANLIKSGALDSMGQKRSEMLALLDKAVARARQRDQSSQQAVIPDFFEYTLQEVSEKHTWDLPVHVDLAELSLSQRFDYERASTGLIFSGYGYESFQDLLERMNISPLWKLTPKMLEKEVHFTGLIDGIERNGFLCRGDIGAAISVNGFLCLVPRRILKTSKSAILSGAPVLLGGRVHNQDGELYVRLYYIQTLEEVSDRIHATAEIIINMIGENQKTAKLILQIMKKYPGATKVRLTNFESHKKSRIFRRIEDHGIIFCPPVYMELLKIFPERAIKPVMIQEEPPSMIHERKMGHEDTLPIF